MISLNERAAEIVRQMIADHQALGLAVERRACGAWVLDAGVQAPGSLEAGRLWAEACLGGLGQVRLCELDFGGLRLPGVDVAVSHPPLACLAAQMAGWPVEGGDTTHAYRAMGSGPARALRRQEPLFDGLGYRDPANVAVLALEAGQLPPDQVVEEIANRCHVGPGDLYLLVAPTASLVGSVQVAARMVEAGMHKMLTVGFDVRTVIAAWGTCPLAPVAGDDFQAVGRTNDAVLYASRAWYWVRTEDTAIEAVFGRLPSSASPEYGTPFHELLQRTGYDFYRIDPLLFSTAELVLNNLSSGRTYRAGTVDGNLVRRMLFP